MLAQEEFVSQLCLEVWNELCFASRIFKPIPRKHNGSLTNLTGSLPTVGFGLAMVSRPVDSLGTLVNMCKCAGRASILCMRTDGNE